MSVVLCDYCKREAKMVTGGALYGRKDLDDALFWKCDPCGAWVGCHPTTGLPMGSLANAGLRAARQATHAVFDRMWKSGGMTRSASYDWLAKAMDLPHHLCHIGLFDEAACARAQKLCNARIRE